MHLWIHNEWNKMSCWQLNETQISIHISSTIKHTNISCWLHCIFSTFINSVKNLFQYSKTSNWKQVWHFIQYLSQTIQLFSVWNYEENCNCHHYVNKHINFLQKETDLQIFNSLKFHNHLWSNSHNLDFNQK